MPRASLQASGPAAIESRDGFPGETWLARLFLGGLAVAAAYLILFGAAPGEIRLLPCPFHSITGLPCPGCGMTRALFSLAGGDAPAAWSYQPFSFVLVALAAAVGLFPRTTSLVWKRTPAAVRSGMVSLLLGAVLLRWIWGMFA